jgi:hypothetical protein
VSITRGVPAGDGFVSTEPGATTLIVRFVEGTNATVKFEWSDKTADLHILWANGKPQPAGYGNFFVSPSTTAPAPGGGLVEPAPAPAPKPMAPLPR